MISKFPYDGKSEGLYSVNKDNKIVAAAQL